MRMIESKVYRYECSICGKIIHRTSKQDDFFECPDCKYEKHYLFSVLNIRKFIKEIQERLNELEKRIIKMEERNE